MRLHRLVPFQVVPVGHGQAHHVGQVAVCLAVHYPNDDPLRAGDIQGPARVDRPQLSQLYAALNWFVASFFSSSGGIGLASARLDQNDGRGACHAAWRVAVCA